MTDTLEQIVMKSQPSNKDKIYPDFLFEDKRLSPETMGIFMIAYENSNLINGQCLFSQTELMKRSHCSQNIFTRHLAILIEYGYVEIKNDTITIGYEYIKDNNKEEKEILNII